MKKHLLVATLFFAAMALSAQEPFLVSSSRLALYNEHGERVALDENAARTATNGWIIQTQEKSVTIQTPVGTLELAPSSTLVTGDLSVERPSLYLVDGQISLSTSEDFTGRLTVSTPVSRYRATGYSGMLIVSNADEESISMFVGSAQSVNGLTHKATQVGAMQMLDQKTGKITALEDNEVVAWKKSLVRIPQEPDFVGVSVVPYQGPIPSQPQILSVTRVPMPPSGLSVEMLQIAPAPAAPKATTTPQDEFFAPAPSQLQVSSVVPVPPAKQARKDHTSQIGVALSYEYDHASDELFSHDTFGPSKHLHQFHAKPYFASKYFGLKLDLPYQSLDFDDWDEDWSTSLSHFAHDGAKDSFSSLMGYVDSFHLGSKDGHIWLAVDKDPLVEEGKIMAGYHGIQPDWKNLSVGMRFGSVRINGSFEDVELARLKKEGTLGSEGWQYGNLSLSLVDDDLSFFSLGAVYALHGNGVVSLADAGKANPDTYRAVSYPYVEANIPFLGNKKQVHFNLLSSASTYLPTMPDMNFDYIYDSDKSSFENYMLWGGFSFGTKKFDMQVTAGCHKGFINPYVRSPFVRVNGSNYLQYESDLDTRFQATYKGQYLSLGVSYTLPFDFDEQDKIARLNGVHADMLSLGLSSRFKGFTLEAGCEVYGLNDLQAPDAEENRRTMLKASLAYDYSILHLEGGLKRNLSDWAPLVGYALCELNFHKGL